jgi:hypothetical protein
VIEKSYREHLKFKTCPKPDSKKKKERLEKLGDARHNLKLDKMQCDTPQDFLKQVKYKIELSQLYEIYDSCNYNDLNQYCPVLVQIKDHLRDRFKNSDNLNIPTP